jgi:hypothetical protein
MVVTSGPEQKVGPSRCCAPVSAEDVSRPLSRPVIGRTYDRLRPTSPAAMPPPMLLTLPTPAAASPAPAHGSVPACSATAAPATAAASAAASSCSLRASQLPAAADATDARCCAA